MTWLEALRPTLLSLFAVELLAAASDALLDSGSEGFRLACGLCAVLSLERLIAGMVG